MNPSALHPVSTFSYFRGQTCKNHLRRNQGCCLEKVLSFSAQLTTQDVWIRKTSCHLIFNLLHLALNCAEKGGGSTLWIAMWILLRCKVASTNLGPELQGGRCAHYSTISYPWGFPRRSMKEMRQAHTGTCLVWPSVSYLALACLQGGCGTLQHSRGRAPAENKFSVWVSAMVNRVVWMPIWEITTLLHQTYPTVEFALTNLVTENFWRLQP